MLTIVFITSFLFNCYLVFNLIRTRLSLDSETKKNYGLSDDYENTKAKYSKLVKDYNKLVKTYNNLLGRFRSSEKKLTEKNAASVFTQDELRKLRHYIHPDKHGGKTDDLFVKINRMMNK